MRIINLGGGRYLRLPPRSLLALGSKFEDLRYPWKPLLLERDRNNVVHVRRRKGPSILVANSRRELALTLLMEPISLQSS